MSKRLLALTSLAIAACSGHVKLESPPERLPDAPRHARVARPVHSTVARPTASDPTIRGVAVKPVVGLVAAEDPAVTAVLARGVRAAFAQARDSGGPDLSLRVGEREDHWGSSAASAVRMALDEGAVAVIAPPGRRRAHEIAQFGTRAGVPVVSTSPADSVAAAGSLWVISVSAPVPDADDTALSDTSSFDSEWVDAGFDAGFDAGCAIAEAVRRNGLRREGLVDELADGVPFAGARGTVAIGPDGRRHAR